MLRLRSTVSFIFVLALAIPAFAQTGSIQGVLVDAAGASIPNAKIAAYDQAKQIVARETISGQNGGFFLSPLLPGRYTIKVEATGFKAVERTDLTLDQNQIMNLGSLTAEVGQTSESVTVEAQVPLVETSTAQKSFVISSRQVTELALNGRDFQSLMRTLPGVVSNDASDFRLAFNNTNSFNVNGARGSANNVFLDGSINTDVGANDGQYTQISLDAVGEFKVQTSAFNAEYGRSPGIMISINTKSGGSQFHGTAYEFLRNNAFDARRPSPVRYHRNHCQATLQPVRRQPRRPDPDPEVLHRRSQEAVLLLQLRRYPRHTSERRHFYRHPEPGHSRRRLPQLVPLQCQRIAAVNQWQHVPGRHRFPARHHRSRFQWTRHRRHAIPEQHGSQIAVESERAGVR